jgi:hypothetical protein
VVTDALVGGIGGAAPRVAHAGAQHSWKAPEPGVGSPESSQGEGRPLRVLLAGHDPPPLLPIAHCPTEARAHRQNRSSSATAVIPVR